MYDRRVYNRFEGLSGFYKGISANLMKQVTATTTTKINFNLMYRVVPATCITFVVYEKISSLCSIYD